MPVTAKSEMYRRLYEAHYPPVLAYCARRVGREDAQDLAAEVFSVAWRRIDEMPRGERSLPWLYGVAYRVVSTHWRSSGRRRKLRTRLNTLADEDSAAPDVQLIQRREYELVLQAASGLRDQDQELLRLAFWEELTNREIAAVLGLKVNAVRQRLLRTRRALLREYERVGGTLPPNAVAQEGGEQ